MEQLVVGTTETVEEAEAGPMMAWARQRVSLYERINRVTRDAIAALLDTAAQIRSEIEADAAALHERLRQESAEIRARVVRLEAERERLGQEVQALRAETVAQLEQRRAERDAELERIRLETAEQVRQTGETFQQSAGQMRADGRAELERTLREAKARRAEIDTEVQALQEQMAEIQQVLDGFLDSQRRTLLGPPGAPAGRAAAVAAGQNGHAK
jgi:uncharacterized protein YhaN